MLEKTIRLIIISGFVVAGTAPAFGSDSIDPICEYPHDYGHCEDSRYEMVYHDNSGPEDYCNGESGRKCILKDQGVTPTPAWINCQPVNATTISCSVHPQGDLHFSWATSYKLSPANPASWSGSSQHIYCNQHHASGTVSVTITTPDGLSDTVFTGVSCGTIVR